MARDPRRALDGLRRTLRTIMGLRGYARPHRAVLLSALLVTVVQVGIDVLRPWPIKIVIDQVILGQNWERIPSFLAGPDRQIALLLVSCAAVLGLAAASGGLLYLRTLALARVGHQIVADVRRDLYKRLLRTPLRYHDEQRSGDLVVRLTGDTSALETLLAEGSFAIVQELLWLVGVYIVMSLLDPKLALVVVLMVPLVAFVIGFFGGRLKAAARSKRDKEGKLAVAVNEAFQAIPVIQAYGLERQAAQQFRSQNRKGLRAGLASARFEGAMSRYTELCLALGTSLLLYFGVQKVLAGGLSAGELLVLLSYGRNLYKPLRRLATRSARMLKATACAERVLEVMTLPQRHDPRGEDTLPVSASKALSLEFEGVSFAYADDAPVLNGLDLRVEAGEHVGLLGTNGAGKSTLISLMPRLREATQGRVLVDGKDVRDWDLGELRQSIAICFQQSPLFDGSLLDNVRMGRLDAEESEVRHAARLAGVEEFARKLPAGLDTAVGESGLALSGGQRQRVTLARALLRNAPILVLDEPDSSLDDRAYLHLAETILDAQRDRTVLLISHRRELLDRMDRLVEISGGRCLQRDALEAETAPPRPARLEVSSLLVGSKLREGFQ